MCTSTINDLVALDQIEGQFASVIIIFLGLVVVWEKRQDAEDWWDSAKTFVLVEFLGWGFFLVAFILCSIA